MDLTYIPRIPANLMLRIIPPKIEVLATGVTLISIDSKHNVTLHYEDETTETASIPDVQYSIDEIDNPNAWSNFRLVGEVQGRRDN